MSWSEYFLTRSCRSSSSACWRRMLLILLMCSFTSRSFRLACNIMSRPSFSVRSFWTRRAAISTSSFVDDRMDVIAVWSAGPIPMVDPEARTVMTASAISSESTTPISSCLGGPPFVSCSAVANRGVLAATNAAKSAATGWKRRRTMTVVISERDTVKCPCNHSL